MINNIVTSDWIDFFPYDNVRPQQEQGINFILNSLNNNKKYTICQFAPGVGKSAIAVTISKYLNYINSTNKSYIITTQKILQDQYIRDFPEIANITAKQNYQCKNKLSGITCDMGLKMNAILSKSDSKYANYGESCVYKLAKKAFDANPISLTNLSYFLNHFNKDISSRNLLVIDECHNVESVVVDHASINITKYFVEEKLKIYFPSRSDTTLTDVISWIKKEYIPKLQLYISDAETKVGNITNETYLQSNSGMIEIKKISEYSRKLEQLNNSLSSFDEKDWVMTISATGDIINIKPLFADKYTDKMIFKDFSKVLMMSATILNINDFCKNIGISKSDVDFLSVDCPFPVENRPIYNLPVGSMSRKHMQDTLPKMLEIIKELLAHHNNVKGIIHANTYVVAKYISDNIQNERLLFHSSDDRTDILNLHISTSEPTVLVSPSFTEGVDLAGEKSRFQIHVKCPFPYLGDNYVKEKMNRVPRWYEWSTTKTIIQSSGRSVRDMDDNADVYLLDSDFSWFIDKNKDLFPQWWKDALK